MASEGSPGWKPDFWVPTEHLARLQAEYPNKDIWWSQGIRAPGTHVADACGQAQPAAEACGQAQPVAKACGQAQPVAKACGQAQPVAKACRQAQPVAKACGHAQPEAKACGQAQPVAKACGQAQPVAKACRQAQPVAKACGQAQPVAKACGHAQCVAEAAQPWWQHDSGSGSEDSSPSPVWDPNGWQPFEDVLEGEPSEQEAHWIACLQRDYPNKNMWLQEDRSLADDYYFAAGKLKLTHETQQITRLQQLADKAVSDQLQPGSSSNQLQKRQLLITASSSTAPSTTASTTEPTLALPSQGSTETQHKICAPLSNCKGPPLQPPVKAPPVPWPGHLVA